MNQPTNEALLRQVIAEDPVVRAYVRSVTRGHRETEDVIQEIWQVVCKKIGDYDQERPLRPWILGITRLQLLKWRQALARSREILAPDVIDLLAETAETVRDELDLRSQYLRECAKQLPGSSRRLLNMKYDAGLTHEEIGRRVGKRTAAIEMAMVRLRRALRACIERKLLAAEEPVP